MAHEIAWAESAVVSLVDAIEHISRDSPAYAAAFAIRAESAAASLADLPHRGRRVAEFDDPNVRELIVGSYRLIYRVQRTRVLILAFVHTARDLGGLLAEDPQ